MLTLAQAEMSVTASNTFGIPFNQEALDVILQALIDARDGKGDVKPDGSDIVMDAKLNPASRKDVDLRRLRMVCTKAARQTAYYGKVFNEIGLNPELMGWDDFSKIPLTHKDAVRDRAGEFMCRGEQVDFLTTTHGTTGMPTHIGFSKNEMDAFAKLCAIFNATIGDFLPSDIFVNFASSRALLGMMTGIDCMQRLGTTFINGGQADPAEALAMLAREFNIPGKPPKPTMAGTYPSFLGEIIEAGHRLGYKASDFTLRRFDLGGEIATKGLKRRSDEFFGPVPFYEGYGMTETWGMGGEYCSQGHLHYGTGGGLWEFINPETVEPGGSGEPAGPGEPASIVATGLPPYREVTLIIRLDTQDMVRTLTEPPTCEAAHLPSASPILGKKKLSVRHAGGWTFPRDVMEALESVDAVPLPARYGFWAKDDGVAVEVVARKVDDKTRKQVGESLEAHGVPVRELTLVDNRGQLTHAFPLRCDLKETGFAPVH